MYEKVEELPWVQDLITGIERDAIEWLYWLSGERWRATVSLIALPWMQDSITETELDALEWLFWLADEDWEAYEEAIDRPFLETLEADDVLTIRRMTGRESVSYLGRLRSSYPAVAKLIEDLPWTQSPSTETELDAIEWLYWMSGEDQDAAATVAALFWVQDGITHTERSAISQLYWLTIQENTRNTTNLEAVLRFPWIQDNITATEEEFLDFLENLDDDNEEAAAKVIAFPWSQDNITEKERDALKWLSWLSYDSEKAAAGLIAMAWFQDGITDTERDAVNYIYWLNDEDDENGKAVMEAVLAFPWIQDGITETEAEAIDQIESLDDRSEKAAAVITAMPFLESLEEEDVLAIRGMNSMAYDGLLSGLLAHPRLRNGITDAQTTLVTAVGTVWDAEEIRRMLNPGYADIETLSKGTELTPNLKISIVRTGSQRQDWTAEGVWDAVQFVEETMQLPLPVGHVIILLNDKAGNKGYGGTNHGFAFDFKPDREQEQAVYGRHNFQSGIVHETAHYFWRLDPNWVDEGVANMFEYIYGIEKEVDSWLLEKPQREKCEAHDLEMLTEWNPGVEEFERFLCNYYLGQSLFLELLESLGVEVFNERLRELYRLSLAAKDTGDTPGIAQVRQAFHDQADVVEKHWSGKLNAPENRPFDEGRYLTNHDLIQWEQYPTYDGNSVTFNGILLGNAVLSSETIEQVRKGGNQNFIMRYADDSEFAGFILPPFDDGRNWTLKYPGDNTAIEYRLEGRTFTLEFPFPESLGDPSDYVVIVRGFRDESREPYIADDVDYLGYARIRVE